MPTSQHAPRGSWPTKGITGEALGEVQGVVQQREGEEAQMGPQQLQGQGRDSLDGTSSKGSGGNSRSLGSHEDGAAEEGDDGGDEGGENDRSGHRRGSARGG